MALGWHLFRLLLSLLCALGTCKRLHMHDKSLINTVGKLTCQPGTLYKGAMPKANVNVDHLKALGTSVSAEECLRLCCDKGQTRCQYLWVFGEACFSVGCDNNGIGCLPQLLPTGVKMDSVYVKMQYVTKETDWNDMEETLDDHLIDKSRDKGNDGVNEKGHPPVADAGGNMTVQMPVDVVHLYGNSSKSDRGIKSYLWQLISDHFVHPILENSNSPVLQIRNLIPGNYTFRLTVTDPDDQSNSAIVVVHVLEGPGSLEAKTTMAASSQPSPAPHTTIGLTKDVIRPPSNDSEVDAEGRSSETKEDANEAYYRKRRIVLKIVVPVLLSVATILTLSAFIVGLSACLCERNRRRMKRFYRYKRIPESIEKI